ncbi:kinase-like domain-containing protein, partial [Circinella umbellata]
VFNIIIEDKYQNRSLVRYVPDFVEFDRRLKAHYRKARVPLPQLVEPHLNYYTQRYHDNDNKKRGKQRNSITSLISRIVKFTTNSMVGGKSNSEKIEMYLRRCALHPIVGRSSLFRDFLAAQRNEDQIVPNSNRIPTPALINNNHSNKSCSSSIASSMITSSLDSCHDSNNISNVNNNNSIVIPGGISIHQTKLTIRDFEILKVLGRGCTGKVFLVRRTCPPGKLLALKAIRKQWVITSRQIEHTKTERDILTKIAKIRHPFLIKLHYAFQDTNQLFLVFDFHVGGDLATQLRNYRVFSPKRCKLYAAEMLLGLEELHRLGILYRDLKPENVLLRADGHLVLTDFSLSKLLGNDGLERTNTFCGTPEYLAPEVLLGEEYSYAVDFWSYGTILYEMIEGEPPFYLENTIAMYRRVLIAPLILPEEFDSDAGDLISGLLQRDPLQRLDAEDIRNHPYFDSIDWNDVYHRRILPPYVPDLRSKDDCTNFDQECLAESPRLSSSVVDDSNGSRVQQNNSGMTFQGYSYINDSQMTEDTP